MELGFDAVLMNTAIAEAQDDPILMAEAMQHGVLRKRPFAGPPGLPRRRMPRRLYATASSPLEGILTILRSV
jgi:thiazole synthase